MPQTHPTAMGDLAKKSKSDILDIPLACQYGNLCSNDTHRIHNENVNWLTERNDKLPLWSRLKSFNCVGHPRQMMFYKDKDYEIEIPGRLLSIFGDTNQQTKLMNKVQDVINQQLVCNVLALCAALRYNFREWSATLLDKIATTTTQLYPELLKKLNITDKEVNIRHLNQLYQLEDVNCQVQLQQVASGYVYMRYGLNEFNLARALTWFFRFYQFGLIQCANRTLAFGCTLDTDYGFFMYDCQSHGFPLFEERQTNSYILRTHHLQILLYCLVITLNISTEMVKFYIYNADIRISNPAETRMLKREIYVPTIATLPKREVLKKVDCGTIKKKVNNKPDKPAANTSSKDSKTACAINLTTKNTLKSSTSFTPKLSKKANTNCKTQTSKSETLKTQNSQKQIPLDPNKMYYIIAVPKQSNIILKKSESKQSSCCNEEHSAILEKPMENTLNNVKVNIKRINTPKAQEVGNKINSNYDDKSETETIYLEKSASTATLTPSSVDGSTNSNDMGLKVYLVDNRAIETKS